MTDEEWEELRVFVEAETEARTAFNSMRAMNTAGVDPRKRIEMEVLYARRRMEMEIASQAVIAARKRILGA